MSGLNGATNHQFSFVREFRYRSMEMRIDEYVTSRNSRERKQGENKDTIFTCLYCLLLFSRKYVRILYCNKSEKTERVSRRILYTTLCISHSEHYEIFSIFIIISYHVHVYFSK